MKLTLTLGLLASSNIVLTVIFQWYVLTQLGVGIETDALFAGMALPQLVLAVVSSSLTHVLVPLLATEDEKTFGQNAWGFFLGISGVFFLISAGFYLSANFWVPLLVPGFAQESQALTVNLTRIQLISMVFTASVSVLWSVHHAKKRFIWAELSATLATLVGLIFLIWSLPLYGIFSAAWTLVIIAGLKVVCLLPGLGNWQKPQWNSTAMLEAWRRTRPLLIGSAYYKTDPLVDRFLASMATSGSLSLLYIGKQIYSLINQVISKAIAAPMIPLLSVHAKAGNWSMFRKIYHQRLLLMAGLTSLVFFSLLVGGQFFLTILIGYGDITPESVKRIWVIMLALFGVLLGGAMGQITGGAFYATGNSGTPTKIAIFTYTIFVPLKAMAFYYYDLIGLALFSSLFFLVNLIFQYVFFKKMYFSNSEVNL